MKIGVVFPQNEIGADPSVVRDYAQTADALGYSHLLAFDHVAGAVRPGREPQLPHGYDEESQFHEPLALFAYLAGITSNLELVTGVLVLPQRQTVLVAKQAAEVAILSGGRLRLGVGTGWNWVEYESLGIPFEKRGKRLDEQVELLRRLWKEPVLDFTGAYHRIDRAGIRPLPVHDIPIWFGGFSEVAYRRAARLGDGFMLGGPTPVDAVPALKKALADAGRDVAGFGIEGRVHFGRGQNTPRWLNDLRAWEDAGATHMALNTMFVGLEPRAHIEAIETFAKETGIGKRR